MNEGHFEGVKVAFRQTRDGMVISFAIHPNDAPGELATLKLGTRLMLAWAAINDDETTAGAAIAQQADTNLGSAVSGRNTSGSPVAPRSWSELPPSARAALLCKKAEFQHWCGAENEDVAAIKVRQRCGVASRSQIDGDPGAHQIFCKIEQDFLRRNEPPPHNGSR